MGATVKVREYDGARSVEMKKVPGFVMLEVGDQMFAFDERHFLHQMKRLLRVSVILEHSPEGDFALP